MKTSVGGTIESRSRFEEYVIAGIGLGAGFLVSLFLWPFEILVAVVVTLALLGLLVGAGRYVWSLRDDLPSCVGVAIGSLLLILVAGIFARYLPGTWARCLGRSTTGRIVRIDRSSARWRLGSHELVYTFSVDGATLTATQAAEAEEVRQLLPGDPVPVRYFPGHPEVRAAMASRGCRPFDVAATLWFASIPWLFFGPRVRNPWRRRRR